MPAKRLMVVAALLLAWCALPARWATADDARTIPLLVSTSYDNRDGSLTRGETCGWSLDAPGVRWAVPQVLVRDEAGIIVAAASLRDGTINYGATPNQAFCELELSVTVPERAFYTLYLADTSETRIQTFAASEFPLAPVLPIMVDPAA